MSVPRTISIPREGELRLSDAANRRQRLLRIAGETFLFLIASVSVLAVLLIFLFIIRDAFPFFKDRGFSEFFLGKQWYPAANPPKFGVLPIFWGSALVTIGAVVVTVPLGVTAAICLSDILPFKLRQLAKPVIEMLAAIPSVAYGFFALVVFAPLMQRQGGALFVWIAGVPLALLIAWLTADLTCPDRKLHHSGRLAWKLGIGGLMLGAGFLALQALARQAAALTIDSGTNALNVSIILGIMALPTIVSVSEDALQAVPRDLREGSYALGATRAETLLKVVVPAAASGIMAACILGIMRAIGETMVVWMASGNAPQFPDPAWNMLAPVRTLTATIAGEMGEADQTTGSARYHVLFAMAFCLLAFSFLMNLASEWLIKRNRKKQAG